MDKIFVNTSPGGDAWPLMKVLIMSLNYIEGDVDNDVDVRELEEQLRYWVSFESPL